MEYIQPFFNNEVTCVFATDNNYALYLGVAIQSLICNASKENNYGIYILEENVDEKYKKILLKMSTDNIKIKIVNTKDLLSNYPEDMFYTHSHFSKATYYRFFITDIFSNFNKVIYLDCDLIINTDIAELYYIDIEENYVGCVNYAPFKAGDRINYIKDLGLKNQNVYFNAGVMIFNIQNLKTVNFTNKCINTLKTDKKYKWLDQDVLNLVCENKIKFIDISWNIPNLCLFKGYMKENRNDKNNVFFEQLEKSAACPKIMHYNSHLKPWNNTTLINAELWWKYARYTIFYETLLYKMIEKHLSQIVSTKNNISAKKILQSIFSITNSSDKKHKILTILGIKIKFNVAKTLTGVETERE